MLLFCPTCANCLTLAKKAIPDEASTVYALSCRSCPYQFTMDKRYMERKSMKLKEVDDIMGGAKAWENADQTTVQCTAENCDGVKAYYYSVQIRSADEPMTMFYKCATCGKRWTDN